MLQQDTVCRDDLFSLVGETLEPDADAIFDQMGFDPDSSRARVINGKIIFPYHQSSDSVITFIHADINMLLTIDFLSRVCDCLIFK